MDFSIFVKNPPNPALDPRSLLEATLTKCDSDSHLGLTILAPLTYPLIIEELRPEEILPGAFVFPTPQLLARV